MAEEAQIVHSDPADIGARIRQLRRAQDLTLNVLAQRSCLSIGYLSNVERGAAIPSLKALSRIAAALGQSVSFFLPDTRPAVIDTRAGQRLVMQVAEGGKRYERLHAEFPGSTFSAYLIVLPPGFQDTDTVLSLGEGEEFLKQLEGHSRCEVGDTVYNLAPGDTLHLPAHLSPRVSNPETTDARLLWVGNTLRPHERQT